MQVKDLYEILRDVFEVINMLEILIAKTNEKNKRFDTLRKKSI